MGVPLVPRIGDRLPTAGLPFRKKDVYPEILQKLQRRTSGARVELVDVAGYEQSHIHERAGADFTFCRELPRPSIPSSTSSPGLRYTCGFMPIPTPSGVPVVTISPGS